jgi:hypothetical protein
MPTHACLTRRASQVKAKRRVRIQFAGGVGTLVPNATFRSSPLKG